ncbi:hypothetical protein [Nocardia sp. CC201C]|uniref:hypothetical protein n=1 Tax=Nocardia sp. CC201C TaxID=3044575 RepID=UPI0024A895D3|nr:hypothetical protein [Nocardia sp. CC201C]
MIATTWTGIEVKALRTAALRWSQERFAEELEITDRTVRNWEHAKGGFVVNGYYAAKLDDLLADLSAVQTVRFTAEVRRHAAGEPVDVEFGTKLDSEHRVRPTAPRGEHLTEITEMKRRELLRFLNIATTTLVTPIDWDRLQHAMTSRSVDLAVVDELAKLNRLLWQHYADAETKATVFDDARAHLSGLMDTFSNTCGQELECRLRELVADSLQLTGEILFDGNHYTEAAHCYTLAGNFAAEADAFDLWACALTRHAYIGLVEDRHADALPLVDQAAHLSRRGDSSLPTRFWVASVRAQALAGLGDIHGCERAFDRARDVSALAEASPVGWLRFTGDRIDEENAGCYIKLGCPEKAEQLLVPLLNGPLSARRRASVLVDLAAAGMLRGDPVQTVCFGGAAVDIGRHTQSGYIAQRLGHLRRDLDPFRGDRHVAHLDSQIATLIKPTR